jgi:hypothetical protein
MNTSHIPTNVMNVKNLIQRKKDSYPFIATSNDVSTTITEYDNFPYNRWFKGVYNSDTPFIAEREAGWRIRDDECYNKNINERCSSIDHKPNVCFQIPCSTVLPCRRPNEYILHNRNNCVSSYR